MRHRSASGSRPDTLSQPSTTSTVAAVIGAALRATARYQEYRDAKRRIAENREQIKRHDADAAQTQADLDALLEEERGHLG